MRPNHGSAKATLPIPSTTAREQDISKMHAWVAQASASQNNHPRACGYRSCPHGKDAFEVLGTWQANLKEHGANLGFYTRWPPVRHTQLPTKLAPSLLLHFQPEATSKDTQHPRKERSPRCTAISMPGNHLVSGFVLDASVWHGEHKLTLNRPPFALKEARPDNRTSRHHIPVGG